MFRAPRYTGDRATDEALVLDELESLVRGEPDLIANMANAASLLAGYLRDVNWVGFYRVDSRWPRELVLGPFRGLPACVRIPFGRGVCGTAAMRRETVIVPDVHAFPGHIACDLASASEIVVPLLRDKDLLAVLDVDSPAVGRFGEEDAKWLEKVAALLSAGA